MNISFAPMEGITVYCYRNVHHALFPDGIDKYYTPFISVYKHQAFKKRDIREILSENNEGIEDKIIPQIMANHAEEIIWGIEELKRRGFKEVNLNMGCPVATVVSKKKGSGMLQSPELLDSIFSEVFQNENVKQIGFSVKTRIGIKDPREFTDILPVLNKYPFSNVIIHPRVRTQMYNGIPDMDIFRWAYENSSNPVSYNGNIFDVEDYERIKKEFPKLQEIMIGRGLVSNPALVREIRGGSKITGEELKRLAESMEQAYKCEIPSEIQIMHKMKELWFYIGGNFRIKDGTAPDKYIHKIKVSRSLPEYRNAVRELYRNCEMD